jgi:hypothetical protein
MPAFRAVVSVLMRLLTVPNQTVPNHRSEEFLYELKAGPAGGRLRRPSSAGSGGRLTGLTASR